MLRVKIKRKILTLDLHVAVLKDFQEKHVEITVTKSTKSTNKSLPKSAYGILSNYSSKEKIYLEKQAWHTSMQD